MDKEIGDVVSYKDINYVRVATKNNDSCSGCDLYGKIYSCDFKCGRGNIILKEYNMKMFTKEDLRDGDIVTRRDGLVGFIKGNLSIYEDNSYNLNINRYLDNFMWVSWETGADIIKVERPVALEVLYERPTEPVIEVILKVDGKESKLSTLSEETLLSIHKISKEN